MGPAALVQGNPCSGRAIQQPLEVEARELIVRLLADMRCECGDCAGIAGLQLGKGLQIALCRWVFVLFDPKRLEGTQRLGPAPQHQIADRSAAEVLDLRREGCADANAGAELLVGGFQPRRDVDGVAIGGVVEEAAAAEIADNGRARRERQFA